MNSSCCTLSWSSPISFCKILHPHQRDFQVKAGHRPREIRSALLGGSRCYTVKNDFDASILELQYLRWHKFWGLRNQQKIREVSLFRHRTAMLRNHVCWLDKTTAVRRNRDTAYHNYSRVINERQTLKTISQFHYFKLKQVVSTEYFIQIYFFLNFPLLPNILMKLMKLVNMNPGLSKWTSMDDHWLSIIN
jgi:hypothetical protein